MPSWSCFSFHHIFLRVINSHLHGWSKSRLSPVSLIPVSLYSLTIALFLAFMILFFINPWSSHFSSGDHPNESIVMNQVRLFFVQFYLCFSSHCLAHRTYIFCLVLLLQAQSSLLNPLLGCSLSLQILKFSSQIWIITLFTVLSSALFGYCFTCSSSRVTFNKPLHLGVHDHSSQDLVYLSNKSNFINHYVQFCPRHFLRLPCPSFPSKVTSIISFHSGVHPHFSHIIKWIPGKSYFIHISLRAVLPSHFLGTA